MMDLNTRTLIALFDLAQADIPATRDRLAAWLGVPVAQLEAVVAHLARESLVDARRLRLTMRGLCHAARVGARQSAVVAAA
jgi:hypothetical protein